MKRWMAGAVTVLAAVAGLAASGPARASSSAWYQTLQVNRSGRFAEIAAISKTNIWAVGELWGKKGNAIFQPFIRHYAGGGWTTVTIPGSPKFESDQVSASAANNVWVIGLTSSSVAHSMAYRYDGSRWHKIPVPAQTYLQGAVALGPKNVWAFGSSGTIFAPGSSVSATVFHWNGTKWRGYSLAHGNLMGESISASARNNVWIAGAVWTGSVEKAVAYRRNGTGWHNAGTAARADRHPRRFGPLSRQRLDRLEHRYQVPRDALGRPPLAHHDHPGRCRRQHQQRSPGREGRLLVRRRRDPDRHTWIGEPIFEATGGFGSVVRIPGTESFLLPASVKNSNSTIWKPTLYRFDL